MTAQGKAALLELRDRLGKATGPDRALDSAIARFFEILPTERFKGDGPFERTKGMYWVFGTKDTPGGPVEEKWSKCPPPYTASLDAAVTLEVPGLLVTVVAGRGMPCAVGWLDIESKMTLNAEAATEPLARSLARVEYELAKAGKP